MGFQRSGRLTFVTSAKAGNSKGHVRLGKFGVLILLTLILLYDTCTLIIVRAPDRRSQLYNPYKSLFPSPSFFVHVMSLWINPPT